MIIAALTLLGQHFKFWRLLLSGLSLATVLFFSRSYLFHLGLHSPVYLIGLIIALKVGFRLSLNLAVTGCFLSYLLLMLGESQVAVPILTKIGISVEESLMNPWLSVAMGWSSASLLIITIMVCRLTGFVLVRSAKDDDIS